MAECLDLLSEYAQIGEEEFMKNTLVQDAIVRRMEVLADSASHLSPELQERHPHVPWRAITGFRNVVAHGYMGVTIQRVWEYLKADIPILRALVKQEIGGD
jgi:uncharacterized protein with HEPN domain